MIPARKRSWEHGTKMDENGLNVESERDGTQLSETGKMERVRERKRARERARKR